MRRRLGMLSIATLALLAPLFAATAAAPAHAATGIEVSLDGIHFGTTLPAGLFDGIGRMVPMDSETATFWVRNTSATDAALRVSLQDMVVSSPALAASIELTSWDSGTAAANSATLNTLAACDVIVPEQIVPTGATIRVDLTLTMMNVTGLTAQDMLGALNFLAAMRDAAGGPFPPSACDDDGVLIPTDLPTLMAPTGSELPTDWLAAGGALVGFGILLVLARRRRKRETEMTEE